MIEIQEKDFDANEIIQGLNKEGVGAIVTFIGIVRDFTEIAQNKKKGVVQTKQLIYETYTDMARKKMEEIEGYIFDNYDIKDMHIAHRIGTFKPSEQVVIIAISATHRKDAFSACEYAIHELKKSVPIWKKEFTQDNEYWVSQEG